MKYILSIIIIVIIFLSITSLIFPNIRKKRNISVKQARIILEEMEERELEKKEILKLYNMLKNSNI